MELQTKATATMSDVQIVELYWQRNEQAIKETDIKYKKFLLSVAYNIVHDHSSFIWGLCQALTAAGISSKLS